MKRLSSLFTELENSTYMTAAYILSRDLSPEFAILLDSAESALGYPIDMITGDRLLLALRRHNQLDLCKEVRAAIVLHNAVMNGENI